MPRRVYSDSTKDSDDWFPATTKHFLADIDEFPLDLGE
jgi:hypothetical protein